MGVLIIKLYFKKPSIRNLVAAEATEEIIAVTGIIMQNIDISAADLSFHAITKNEAYSTEACIAVSSWKSRACNRIRWTMQYWSAIERCVAISDCRHSGALICDNRFASQRIASLSCDNLQMRSPLCWAGYRSPVDTWTDCEYWTVFNYAFDVKTCINMAINAWNLKSAAGRHIIWASYR